MADVPDSKRYQYAGDHVVSPGDPTEAADDYNRASYNTDHLRDSKLWGWKGTNYEGGARVMQESGGGFQWVGTALEDSVDLSIIAASTLKIPLDIDQADGGTSSWLKYRLIEVEFHAAILIHASTALADARKCLPGGNYEEYLATEIGGGSDPGTYTRNVDYNKTTTGTIRGMFYSGPGGGGSYKYQQAWSNPCPTPGPNADAVFTFYVASADSGTVKDGDLVCEIVCDPGYPAGAICFAIHGRVTWGPVWEAT